MNEELQRFWLQEFEKEFASIKVRHKPPLKCRIKFLLRARGVVEPYETFHTCRLLLIECNDKKCRGHTGCSRGCRADENCDKYEPRRRKIKVNDGKGGAVKI